MSCDLVRSFAAMRCDTSPEYQLITELDRQTARWSAAVRIAA
jgi:hypothetical protein